MSGSYREKGGMADGLSAYLRDLAGKVERGDLCNGEVWERLYADGPVQVDYNAGPARNVRSVDTNNPQESNEADSHE